MQPQTIDTLERIEPSFYSNGFLCGHSASDAFIVFQRDANIVAEVRVPFEILKTMSIVLPQVIEQLEGRFGRKIDSLPELREKLENTEPK